MDQDSQNSDAKGGANGGNGLQGQGLNDENFSPFNPPNEEQVFIAREAEKQKKKEEKEAAKHLKIWDKKTATSRMPLKKVKDSDIQPLQSEENLFNFSAQQRGYISAAVHIAQSRVQFPREQRTQNINEFIDQKKEMFMVEYSCNQIKDKIKEIEQAKNRKRFALQDSSAQLEKDNTKLMNFIEKDNMTTQDKTREAEQATNERKKAENEIKGLDTKIQTLKSDIDKTVDQLNSLDDYKTFLFKIFENENPKWVEDQKNMREKKLNKIRKDFVKQMMSNKDQQFDDEIYLEFQNKDAQNMLSQAGSMGGSSIPGRGGKKGQSQMKQMTEKDWEKRFEQLLAEDLIDVKDENFYNEEILFDDPEQLMNIFSYLEEKNLAIIKKAQETEQTLEMRKQQEIQVTKQLGGEFDVLESQKRDIEAQLANAKLTLNDLKKQSKTTSTQSQNESGAAQKAKKSQKPGEEDEEVDIDQLMEDMRKQIIEISLTHRGIDQKKVDQDPSIMQGLQAKSVIQILQEIEISLFDYFKMVELILTADKKENPGFDKLVLDAEKAMKEKNNAQRKEDKQKEDQRNREKMQRDAQARLERVVKKVGKKEMACSTKPVMKIKEVKKVVPPETLDQLRYLELDLKQLTLEAQQQQQNKGSNNK